MTRGTYWKYSIYALMSAYVLFIVASLYRIDALVKQSEDYAIATSRAAREVRYWCIRLDEALPDIFASAHLPQAEIERRIKLEESNLLDAENRLAVVFTGSPQVVARLHQEIMELSRLTEEGRIELGRNTDHEAAISYYEQNVQPQNRLVNQILDEVAEEVAESLGEMQDYVHGRIRLIIIFSLLSGFIIIIGVMFYDRRVAEGQAALAYRERLFQQLADSIDEIFIIAANSRSIEYISTNARRILGLSARKVYENPQVFYELLAPADAEWLTTYLNGAGSGEGLERDVYLPSRDMNLKIRVYSICVASLQEERVIIVISDQTAEVRHQEALSDSLEVAQAASAAKSSFLSHMSHEIRTPMNAIIGMTTIALSRISDQFRVKDCLVKISDSSRHLLGLINDVLDMSQIEAGKLAICHEKFNLQDIVEHIGNIVSGQAKSKALKFEIIVEDVENESLVGDSLRLNQILLNVLSNALKFTPAGGQVTLRISQVNKRGIQGIYRFVVSDSGIGMSPDFVKRIYLPFEQATASGTSKYGGTGLGMSITANLVNMMSGNIQITSKEGEGSTFSIELPFEIAEKESDQGAISPIEIMVVSDVEDPILAEILHKLGHKIISADSGEQAVEILRQRKSNPIQLCLVDWQSPDTEEICKLLRQESGPSLQILAVCGHDCGAIEGKIREAGADELVMRPFFTSRMQKILEAALERAQKVQGEPENTETAPSYDFAGKRILLAEDNEFNTEVALEFLDMVNAEAEHAANGKEAVDKFTASPAGYYDLILMDVQMPVMGGYEATRAIRASAHPDAATIPIMALTANAFNEDVARATAAGMNGHLAKPIDIKALYAAMAHYLYNSKS